VNASPVQQPEKFNPHIKYKYEDTNDAWYRQKKDTGQCDLLLPWSSWSGISEHGTYK